MDNQIQVIEKRGRRCSNCGAATAAGTCRECGHAVTGRTEIGMIAGVNQNFGTVNNVYNFASQGPEPEIVDLRDIQDGLNARFPERISVQAQVVIPPSRQLTPSRTVRAANSFSYFLTALFVFGMIAAYFLVTRG